MIHVGDITKLNGAKLEPVWCITGGSPCQDLSVAGKGKGLAGKRSGLYMEQIRVVKEMREHDKSNGRTGELVRPRYMVWENVPGAFASNGGADFQTVLEELVRIVEPDVVIPRPENGKWQKAGFIIGDGWSVAWRTHDAQYWGVPQRRRRICLVADFNGYTAGDVVFERVGETERPGDNEAVTGLGGEPRPQILPFGESLSGDFEPRRTAQQEAPRTAGTGATPTVAGGDVRNVFCLQGNGIDRADTAGCNGKGWREDVSYTLNTIDRPAVMAFAQNQRNEVRDLNDCAGSLAAEPGMKQQTYVAGFKLGNSEKAHSIGYALEQSPTLQGGVGSGGHEGEQPAGCMRRF